MLEGLVETLNSLPPEARQKMLGALGVVIGSAFQPVQAWFSGKATRITKRAQNEAFAERLEVIRRLRPTGAEVAAVLAIDAPERVQIQLLERLSSTEKIATRNALDREITELSNLLKIGVQASGMIKEVDSAPINTDWLNRFRRECAGVSDADMQTLWAKLLAGEVEKPGRFSLRTVDVVSKMRRTDAENFSRLCGMVWTVRDEGCVVADNLDELMTYANLTILNTRYLEYAGLAHFNTNVKVPIRKGDVLSFFDTHSVTAKRHFGLISYPLTDVGFELLPLAGPVPNIAYFAYSKPLVDRAATIGL